MALATPDKLAVIEASRRFARRSQRRQFAVRRFATRANLPPGGGRPCCRSSTSLKDLGNLDPSTRLEVDNVNKAIIVSGPLVDHVTVKSLIDKLDGSARQFDVITLRKLDADYVAGSIEFLMRGPNKDNNRPRYIYDFGGGGNRQADAKDPGFQVEPDIKNNRLLLRANPIEMEEIRPLMVKLGEDPT